MPTIKAPLLADSRYVPECRLKCAMHILLLLLVISDKGAIALVVKMKGALALVGKKCHSVVLALKDKRCSYSFWKHKFAFAFL